MPDPLRYHHSRELDHVIYGQVVQARLSELLPHPDCSVACSADLDDAWHEAKLWWEPCYDWLAERVGFYPIFLGVGDSPEARHMTGYSSNWRRWLSRSREGIEWIPAGQFPNQVLFSWHDAPHPQLRFTDYDWWHIVLNSVDREADHEAIIRPLSAWDERRVLKSSWSRRAWERYAEGDPYAVQALVPALDLSSADEIYCRNQTTRRELIHRGFSPERIQVRRLPVEL